MKAIIKITSVLLLAVVLISTGCNSARKSQCGCPNKQGMVGYK